jgi:phenylpropionate dioxygenase-like ring-hydroxylating dioxygenase large terminal subunit
MALLVCWLTIARIGARHSHMAKSRVARSCALIMAGRLAATECARTCQQLKRWLGRVVARRLEVREQGGFVLVRDPQAGPQSGETGLPKPLLPNAHVRFLQQTVVSEIADVAENALDTTHTSIVHAGYLRSASRRRKVQPVVLAGPDWIEARYPADAAPSGLLGFLAGGQQYEICDRFRAPGIAEIEYSRNGTIVFAIAFHFTPAKAGQIEIFAAISAPGGPVFGALKTLAARAFLAKVFSEDTQMLGSVAANRSRFGSPRHVIMPQDLLRRGIDAILDGRPPEVPAHVPQLWI